VDKHRMGARIPNSERSSVPPSMGIAAKKEIMGPSRAKKLPITRPSQRNAFARPGHASSPFYGGQHSCALQRVCSLPSKKKGPTQGRTQRPEVSRPNRQGAPHRKLGGFPTGEAHQVRGSHPSTGGGVESIAPGLRQQGHRSCGDRDEGKSTR